MVNLAKELKDQSAIVVFPTRRAKLYFWYYLHRLSPQPQIPPRVFSFVDLVEELAVRIDPKPILSKTEQAWLLWHLVRQKTPFAEVAQSFDRFFPWGLRLAELLEILEKEMIQAQNIPYPPEEDVPQEARLLLEHIGDIQQKFNEALREKGYITAGQRLRLLAERAPELDFPPKPLHLAGFFVLTKAEQILFKHWLDRGATLWWQADPTNLPEALRKQQEFFKAPTETYTFPYKRPTFKFYEAPDIHHELATLRRLLPQEVKAPDEALILLCAAGNLIPLLYELPEGLPVNVTLGYPLFRTPLAHLLLLFMEVALSLQEDRLHVPAYLRLLKHPYMRGLKTPAGEELHLLFQRLETTLRERGSPYLCLSELEALAPKSSAAALRWFHNQVLRPWLSVSCTHNLASAIKQTLEAVLYPRLNLLKGVQNPEVLVERAFFYTLETEILPTLEQAPFAKESLKKNTLFTFLRDLLRTARAPFEGEPLEGLQVMGLLETRLLTFKKIFILDANEGYLPSLEEVNPLMPEGIKPLLGLPLRENEETIQRYHFFSLLKGSEEVFLFYQSAVSGKGEAMGKKLRSRYLEELLWEEEKRAQKLLPELVSSIPLVLHDKSWRRKEEIPKGQAEKEALEEILFKNPRLSATLFNTYLECPVKFYFRYVLGLSAPQEVANFDAAELGDIVHHCLEEYFQPWQGKLYLPREHNDYQSLEALFKRHFTQSTLYQRLGPERRFFIEETALFRLKRYLKFLEDKHAEGFTIVALEKEIQLCWENLALYGRLDRLEKRADLLHVLDYKTGSFLKGYSPRHIEEKLLAYDPPKGLGAEEFFDFQERMPDIQLFFYLFLTKDLQTQNAIYVKLATGGQDLEKPLFSPEHIHQGIVLSFIEQRFPKMLEYLVRHILYARAFFAVPEGKQCKFCDFKLCCECAKW